jgi:beta-glucosidase
VARAGYATVFPQAIGLAATWDTRLLEAVGAAISDEARAKHHDFVRKGQRRQYQGLTFWSPNINLFRDPRWGRGMETFGEDPTLTGKCGAAFIRGLQGNHPRYLKVVGTMKHFAVHSGPEPDRHSFDVYPSERDLYESYLPHFRMCVEEANVQSVMCAYNRFAGDPCCGSNVLLERILRKEWGFDGYVTSDCGAIGDIYMGHKVKRDVAEATALAIRAGTDLNCSFQDAAPVEAVRRGLLTETELNRAIGRLFRARFMLGMFDPPEMVPYGAIPMSVVGSPKHRSLALEAARKSIVLLKNDGNILPIRNAPARIAVIGPNAHDVVSLLGNYYGVPDEAVTPLEGLRERAGKNAAVTYSPGARFADGVPLLEVIDPRFLSCSTGNGVTAGLHAEYFRGRQASGTPHLSRIDANVDFTWCTELPLDCGDSAEFAVRWTGILTPPVSGLYTLGTYGFRAFSLTVGDSVVSSATGGSETPSYGSISLQGGKPYPIHLEAMCRRSGSLVQLLWEVPESSLLDKALESAKEADVIILTLGLSPRLEGEEMEVAVPGFHGGDRTDITLPDTQRRLLRAVASLGKPVILVLLNGSALALPEISMIPAVVEAWYPGQAGGTAIAEILFGDVNPSGRLPITFYRETVDIPPFADYSMEGRTYRFFTGKPLFPFGHGLSYTSFTYANARLSRKRIPSSSGDTLWVSVDLANRGERDGEEVAQLYVRALESSVPRPVKELRGFQRVSLKKGEKATVRFGLRPMNVAFFDSASHAWVAEKGEYEVLIGASSEDIRERARFSVE